MSWARGLTGRGVSSRARACRVAGAVRCEGQRPRAMWLGSTLFRKRAILSTQACTWRHRRQVSPRAPWTQPHMPASKAGAAGAPQARAHRMGAPSHLLRAPRAVARLIPEEPQHASQLYHVLIYMVTCTAQDASAQAAVRRQGRERARTAGRKRRWWGRRGSACR